MLLIATTGNHFLFLPSGAAFGSFVRSAPRFFVPPGLSKGTLPEVLFFFTWRSQAFRFGRDQTCMSFLVTRDFVWGLCKGTLPKDSSVSPGAVQGPLSLQGTRRACMSSCPLEIELSQKSSVHWHCVEV